jgi:hypothetical protein
MIRKMLLKHVSATVAVVMVFSFHSCNIIDPEEEAPSYIEVSEFAFDPTPTSIEMDSSYSRKITDVWVYVDNEFQGAYQLPARFPVLNKGIKKILLTPVFEKNLIAATRSPYPFYKGYVTEAELKNNETISLSPTTGYFDLAQCAFCEDFNGSGISLDTSVANSALMQLLPANDPNAFEYGSGVVHLDSTNSLFEITSNSDYELPGAGAAVYLELDYKCTQEMQVGLYVEKPFQELEKVPVFNINPSNNWNKIYIQLGYAVTANSNSDNFRIYFKGFKRPDSQSDYFYFDNIKVVYF